MRLYILKSFLSHTKGFVPHTLLCTLVSSFIINSMLCCCWVASVVSDSVQPHRRQPARLPRPWDSPGKNTGVGCHCLLQCMKVKRESEVAQSCPTLSDPMDCSPPGSSAHGISQARVLEWVATAFSQYALRIFLLITSHLLFSGKTKAPNFTVSPNCGTGFLGQRTEEAISLLEETESGIHSVMSDS